MPSAANVKIEKQIASDNNALADNANNTPLRQGITIIEHKIRNLEKRKSKLESYRDLQRSGKDLNQDQKTAVAKYDEVVQTLEFARDLYKQFLGIAVVSEKDDKKRARKEAIARSQAELTKVREVLLVQDALANMGQDVIREDFLNGRNGASTLTQSDLKLLDDLYGGVTPKHEAGDPTVFTQSVQAAAEHLVAVVDGKPKEAFGGTYSQIKEVIGKIHESGYLDQAVEPYVEESVPVVEEPAVQAVAVEPIPAEAIESMTIDSRQQPPMASVVETLQQQQQPQQPMPPQQQQQPLPVQMEPVPMQQLGPEQIYYQQPPPPPQPRLSEVIGNGSFYFIQDSELDTPPEQIPSQTFTNQTYVTAPPPPIPMPPHFQQFPNAPQQQQPQPVQQQLPPPQQQQQQQQQTVMPQPPQQQQQQPPQQMVGPQTNNGIGGDHLPESHHDDLNRQRNQRTQQQQQPQQQRPNNAPPQQQQPFFANNNGYNNRPNRNRNNGPRTNNRQHNQ